MRQIIKTEIKTVREPVREMMLTKEVFPNIRTERGISDENR
jgi:hypothetical protein